MSTTKLQQFRYQLYQHVNKRAGTTMELLDALSSQTNARSVVELSLDPLFRRQYSSVFDAIAAMKLTNQTLARLAAPHLRQPQQWPFYRLCVDVTPQPRPFAHCLPDRGFVYSGSGKRVHVGHQYSSVVSLPEVSEDEKTWAMPLAVSRVKTTADKELVGAKQVAALMADETLPFSSGLTVLTRDTYYSKPAFLCHLLPYENLVLLVRVRADRVFYCQPNTEREGCGRPKWYGDRFVLADPETWPEPDATWSTQYVSERGHQRFVSGSSWHNILMRGKRKPWLIPRQRYPFTLIRIAVTNADGTPAFRRPLWLILIGRRRHAVTLSQAYETFQQRFRQEHGYRFLKQRLLLTAFQTPSDEGEEAWWRFVHLAYFQLWVARPLVACLPRPWERYAPRIKAQARSPTMVQRDLGRILRQVGTPAKLVKQRGNSPGRQPGYHPQRRPRHPTVRKRAKTAG